MGLLPDTQNCRLRMRRERFPRHRLQMKLLVSDPGMHHGTCDTHVPWCMPGSRTPGGGENVPGIPGACATRNFAYLVRGPLVLVHGTHWSKWTNEGYRKKLVEMSLWSIGPSDLSQDVTKLKSKSTLVWFITRLWTSYNPSQLKLKQGFLFVEFVMIHVDIKFVGELFIIVRNWYKYVVWAKKTRESSSRIVNETYALTHWGRVTHICVIWRGHLWFVSPVLHQAITLTSQFGHKEQSSLNALYWN